ncbi:MAG: S-methyl-5'-thioadenosine phosphorylase [Vampirovibrionales bacterium]|nr:S-methyl-5'-thioadenosine phosphorylase [Vampirovibrionales bacterium]
MPPFHFPITTPRQAEIGVFGGSGFYNLLENPERVQVETPYGAPSATLTIGTIGGKKVAFLPRHGEDHSIPPHKINYRANVWAFKSLGITRVISPCAAGSLQKHYKPGDFVFCDQFVDRTNGRTDTFYDGPITTHVSAADPFDEPMRQVAIATAKQLGIPHHETGTVVVIQGPRFSTRSESQWFRSMGWEVINMTQYPEVHLVKELEMASLSIALMTDYDSGVDGIEPVSHAAVLEVFKANNAKLKELLFSLIANLPADTVHDGLAGMLNSARGH